MGLYRLAAVDLGASLGAWLPWWRGQRLNRVFPAVPLGTLSANLLSGLLVGVAITVLNKPPGRPPELRLLGTTGLMGGLTTFSTFSAEIPSLLSRAEYLWAAAHLSGSLTLTGLGILTVELLSGASA